MWPVIGALGSSLIGGIASAFGAKSANDATKAATDKQIAFQDDQSRTQYQRAMTDMKAAGLNPMLAYSQGGNSSASGASYVAQNVGDAAVRGAQGGAGAMDTGVNSARQSNMMQTQIENIKADTAAKGSTAHAADASAIASMANAQLANANSATTDALRQFQVQQAASQAGLTATQSNQAGLRLRVDSEEGKYLKSPLGALLRQFSYGAKDAGSGINSALSVLKAR